MKKPFAAFAAVLLFVAAPAAAQLQYMDYSGGNQPPPGAQVATPAPQEQGHTFGFGGTEPSNGANGNGDAPYSGFGMQTSTVTPLDECLKQLPPEEAAEVKMRYIQPYRECRLRLAGKAEEQRHIEVTKQREDATPETPRNYVRVQKDPKDDMPKGAKGGKDRKNDGFYGIKPDTSRTGYNR